MSKKIRNNQGKKRQIKTQRRKTLTCGHAKKKGTVEERIIKRAKHYIKNNKTIDTPDISIEEMSKQCKEQLANLIPFHYYLIFVREMLNTGSLKSFTLNYDAIKVTKSIKQLHTDIDNLIKLDDEILYVQITYIAETIEDLAKEILEAVNSTEEIEKTVNATIAHLGERLPAKENGMPYSEKEKYNKVLSLTAIGYIGKYVFNLDNEEAVGEDNND